MVSETFHKSKIENKTGISYTVFWNKKGDLLYENGDVTEYEVKGITDQGRKFTGTGVYLNDRSQDKTWLAKVIDIVPNRSLGFHPTEEK